MNTANDFRHPEISCVLGGGFALAAVRSRPHSGVPSYPNGQEFGIAARCNPLSSPISRRSAAHLADAADSSNPPSRHFLRGPRCPAPSRARASLITVPGQLQRRHPFIRLPRETSMPYSDEQIRGAMLAAIQFLSSVRHTRKGLEFHAWWRGGDDWSCIYFPATGAWADVVDPPRKGNAAALAERMGLTFWDFMQEYGTGPREPAHRPLPPAHKEVRQAVPPAELEETWVRLCDASQARQEAEYRYRQLAVKRWLVWQRGFPAEQLHLLKGFVGGADMTTLSMWPHPLQGWCRTWLCRGGPALCSPLRSAADGLIHSCALRFLSPPVAGSKVICLPLPQTASGDRLTPLGYGLAGESLRRPIVILTEGMVDTLASMALLNHESVANVGSISAGEMSRRWADWLLRRKDWVPDGRVVVVYHLDEPKVGPDGRTREAGPEAAVELVASLRQGGVSARLFDWGSFAECLEAYGAPEKYVNAIKDLADAVKLSSECGIAWSALQSAFLSACEGESL